ncbi:COG1470 family protein [Mesorhizobium carmichaelinearum]|uniref:COG1470 family protein n=1 Tax=Mesorhizobium carmichaelinearum TaxID=1208188 RepID=UPI001FCE8C4A|nr:NEW3 domain-containing protein [Mesorhizobium carmichaelinearum]
MGRAARAASGEAVAGKESTFQFTLTNTGSAPATDLELSASQPTGWKVEFEPKRIDTLAPNATSQVDVKITPSERAIVGHYMVPVRASGGTVSESAPFRVTVKTSAMWGIAGLGVIAGAVARPWHGSDEVRTAMSTTVIEAKDLAKRYGAAVAVFRRGNDPTLSRLCRLPAPSYHRFGIKRQYEKGRPKGVGIHEIMMSYRLRKEENYV